MEIIEIASHALKQFNIAHRFFHLDTTTFGLHGEYNSKDEVDETKVIKITKGLSKDNTPEFNQVVVSHMTIWRSSATLVNSLLIPCL